ncbi:hypothetical protein ACJ41O_007802 [Fusarium nematophilum]
MADKPAKRAAKGKPVSLRKTPTSLRQTRARSRLLNAPTLMKGLDQRGRPLDPLVSDPENITYTEVIKKLRSRRKITLHTKSNRGTSPETQSNQSSANSSSLSAAPESSSQSIEFFTVRCCTRRLSAAQFFRVRRCRSRLFAARFFKFRLFQLFQFFHSCQASQVFQLVKLFKLFQFFELFELFELFQFLS